MASTVLRNRTSPRLVTRHHRKTRIRRKIVKHMGEIARLVVYRSNSFLYAQVIDDLKGQTIAQANTGEGEFKSLKSKKNLEAATQLGKMIGSRATEKKIERVLFDRNGYTYHGRIKAIADGAREAGLKF